MPTQEHVREYQRRYREANREKAREYNKAYHAANREKRREYDRRRREQARAEKQATKQATPTHVVEARKVRKVLTTKAFKYGLDAAALSAWYEKTWLAQKGRCPVCGVAFDGTPTEFTFTGSGQKMAGRAVIDHNHDTGALRGLLCSSCNTLVGRIERDPSRAISAVDYVLAHEPVDTDPPAG
jgi:hypothetical protein